MEEFLTTLSLRTCLSKYQRSGPLPGKKKKKKVQMQVHMQHILLSNIETGSQHISGFFTRLDKTPVYMRENKSAITLQITLEIGMD